MEAEYTIVQEVPGVPRDEQFYIRTPNGKVMRRADNTYAQFASIGDAKRYLAACEIPKRNIGGVEFYNY